MEDCTYYTIKLTPLFDRTFKKLKRHDPETLRMLENGIAKIVQAPMLGKPLRNALRNYRRIHIASSFVLLYEVKDCKILLIDFDHHDRIYKKYS